MNELALFAGAGGGILGGMLLGWRTVAAVEIEDYPRRVLLQRQADGILPRFPIWDDVTTFDGRPWRGRVDVVSGGFPCQDISVAGKGAGIGGARSGLWSEMARIISEVRPRYAWIENSPMLVQRGLERVLSDLAEMGYDARWGIVSAENAGALHKRERIWILADSGNGTDSSDGGEEGEAYGVQGVRRKEGRSGVLSGTSVDTKILADADKIGLQSEGTEQQTAGSPECGQDVVDASEIGRSGCEFSEGEGGSRPERQETSTQGGSIQHSDKGWWATEPDVGRVAHGVAARVDRLRAIGNGQCPQAMALAWKILTGEERV
jgi:DNA (cytosine-5)-methyltransferase 1